MSFKAVFFDRDDTLIEDPGYISDPGQVKLLDGAAHCIAQLRQMGFKIVIVTNQSGIARGMLTEKVLEKIHHRLKELLAHHGAYVDGIYFCPYHVDGVVPEYTCQSDMRKPAPGMLLKAAEEMNIDLGRSWMVGNAYHDVTAGDSAGCKTILINSPVKPAVKSPADAEPFRQAVNIKEAMNIIKMFDRSDEKLTAQPAEIPTPQPKQQDADQKKSKPAKNTPPPRKPKPIKDKPMAEPTEQKHPEKSHHHLLEELLSHLKLKNRNEMYDEFCIFKLMAGIFQVVVFLCLVLSIVFLLDKTASNDSVMMALAYAAVVQLMTIAFYIMRDRK